MNRSLLIIYGVRVKYHALLFATVLAALSYFYSENPRASTTTTLPSNCYVSGRPATTADLKKECATFMFDGPDVSSGRPLSMRLPQYAWFVDQGAGKQTAVILIQAEEGARGKFVGYREMESTTLGVAKLDEMILLGTQRPAWTPTTPSP